MVVALDSNTAIDFLRGFDEIKSKVFSFKEIYLPVVVCGELMFGAANAHKQSKNQTTTLEFISTCKILSSNLIVAELYAKIRLDLKKKGTPIPENYIWIASICSANSIPLFTQDSHFKLIDSKYLQLIEL
jgi:tRNA(fMet)-specific endonuclease VapC